MSGPNIATRCSGLLSKQTLACCVLVHHVAGCVHLGCVVTVGETLFCLNHDLAHLLVSHTVDQAPEGCTKLDTKTPEPARDLQKLSLEDNLTKTKSDQPVSDQPVSEQPVSDQPVSDQPVSDEPAVEGDIKALLEQDAIGHANPASAMQATLTTKPEHQPKVQLHDGTKVYL